LNSTTTVSVLYILPCILSCIYGSRYVAVAHMKFVALGSTDFMSAYQHQL